MCSVPLVGRVVRSALCLWRATWVSREDWRKDTSPGDGLKQRDEVVTWDKATVAKKSRWLQLSWDPSLMALLAAMPTPVSCRCWQGAGHTLDSAAILCHGNPTLSWRLPPGSRDNHRVSWCLCFFQCEIQLMMVHIP